MCVLRFAFSCMHGRAHDPSDGHSALRFVRANRKWPGHSDMNYGQSLNIVWVCITMKYRFINMPGGYQHFFQTNHAHRRSQPLQARRKVNGIAFVGWLFDSIFGKFAWKHKFRAVDGQSQFHIYAKWFCSWDIRIHTFDWIDTNSCTEE